ncbi:MAG TPA: amidohydrolase family protein [Candidatus Binatia bacterium]
MDVIDADGHIEESPAMFELIEEKYRARRPLPLGLDRDTVYGANNAVWLIDGKVYPKLVGKGGVIFRTPTLMESARQKHESIPAQELTDVAARLKDLDKMGIDKQVVYPSLFLSTTTDDVELEAALLRAYNSFLGNVYTRSGGRIMFAALLPIRDLPGAISELKRAKGIGAASVMLHGLAWDKPVLGHPTLFPLYEEAARLDLPVCVHLGWGSPEHTEIFDARTNFYSAILPVLMGFFSLMTAGVMEAFPRLKLAFLESGCFWLPFVMRQVKTNPGRQGNSTDPAKYFREGRAFVGCEADEDLNYIASWIGEDGLVTGSDYPHGDPSRQEDMVKELNEREDISPRLREKILSDNPRRLYGL